MNTKGFTLIELLVVIAILGLVAAVVAMNVAGKDDDARWRLSQTEIRKLKGHIELFKVEQNRLPDRLEDLVAKRYLDEMPKDTWGRPLEYRVPGQRGQPFDIVCYGADGVPGGTGPDEDIWSHPPR